MNFEPSSLIGFLTFLVWLGGMYYAYKKEAWKSMILLIVVGLSLTLFNPFNYNSSSGGYGSIERFQSPQRREIPERFKVEPDLPFEERVNRDIQKLEEDRSE